jgi:amidophosphoribosyltransferase
MIKEECGVFGIYDNDGFDVSRLTYYGLYSLQHRGQESCGIAVNDGGIINYHKNMGLVPEVFTKDVIEKLKGKISIGHVRYSTTGDSLVENAQPLVTRYVKGTLAIAHNGNLVNTLELRKELENSGAIFQTTNDSEVIMHLCAIERVKSSSVEQALLKVMDKIVGAYSLLVMSPQKLIAIRDPQGFRPLCLGKLDNSYVVASESCALDVIKAKFIRDLEPGEIVIIDKNGVRSIKDKCGQKHSHCIFEYIYFARSDSIIDKISVYSSRLEAGRILARTHPVDADMVIGVPDSGLDAAMGYSLESGIPYGKGFVKNSYVGRTFIQPTQSMRQESVNIKLNVIKANVEGKRVVMVDDSIVRGTTCANIIAMLKEAGAKEVHMRVSSPPFIWPCYFGTDIPSKENLIACKYSVDEIRDMIKADSLGYIHVEKINDICKSGYSFCNACFSGEYSVKVPEI